ncbi:class II aldolase/adducin family protein [Ruminococcaceae bacterium OttesenSCG-928-I18]|nr:class II aldolase/adducin family protein [Ruminococcaceae bacterium OttesenSCG-928-I18]
MQYEALREQFCEVGRRMYAKNFGGSNDGNLSVRLDEERVMITPGGVSKGFLKPGDMLVVDRAGTVLEGQGRPSSETRMHLKIYACREDVHAVCHAHPQKATAFAACRKGFEEVVLPEVLFAVGEVRLAPYATPTTEQVPNAIESVLAEADAILLSNHGAVTLDRDLFGAFYRMEALEHAASILLYAQMLGGGVPLSGAEVEQLRKVKEGLYPKKGGGGREA